MYLLCHNFSGKPLKLGGIVSDGIDSSYDDRDFINVKNLTLKFVPMHHLRISQNPP